MEIEKIQDILVSLILSQRLIGMMKDGMQKIRKQVDMACMVCTMLSAAKAFSQKSRGGQSTLIQITHLKNSCKINPLLKHYIQIHETRF